MKQIKFFLAALVLTGLFSGTLLQAAPTAPAAAALQEKETVVLKPLEKLGRGIANVAFSPLELPMKVWDVNINQGGIAGLCYGPFKGLAFMVARIGVGLIDIATFPIPLPNCPEDPMGYGYGYGPIMYPAWVVDVEHDWWNFVYNRDSIPGRDR